MIDYMHILYNFCCNVSEGQNIVRIISYCPLSKMVWRRQQQLVMCIYHAPLLQYCKCSLNGFALEEEKKALENERFYITILSPSR